MKRSGFLISFEGGEGCGKSTQVKKFLQYLQEKKIDFLLTREPGGTDVGEKIRDILLHEKSDLSANTEFLLFSASRSKLVKDVILPALEDGKVVVMDRYFDSSFAYQGFGGGMDLGVIEKITELAVGENLKLKKSPQSAVPKLTFLLDLSYDDGMKRKSADENLKNLDRIESKAKEYHDRVRTGYLKLAKRSSDRIFVVDASKTPNEVFEDIKNEFEKRYSKISFKQNLFEKGASPVSASHEKIKNEK